MKCFHHDDADGKLSGAIVAYYENDYNLENFFKVDYLMDLTPMINKVESNEKVYFVDYSFTESTKWVLDKLKEKNCNIIWIDHHSSSINLQAKYSKLQLMNGCRSKEYAGCALTYMYFNDCCFNDCPYSVKLVSDYDTWTYHYGDTTTYFKLALDSCSNEALGNLWKNLLDYKDDITLVNSFVERGQMIKGYVDANNKEYCDNYSYVSEIAGYKCLVVNKKSNSWVFGEHIKEFPLVMVWAFNGEKYSYSIFSTNNNVDCSKIAESYGGGGHTGAAGFSLNNMPFKKTDERGF